MVSEEQAKRVARAQRQDFTFTSYNPGEWICETEAGHAYLVTEGGQCTCPDSQYRCTERGERCKHAVALGHHLIAIQPRPAPKLAEKSAEEDTDRMFDRIFGDRR